ncbi:MAG TPA: hypothetical protein VGM38_03370 [Pseudolysinimonas sp.]|jgi:dihydroorotase
MAGSTSANTHGGSLTLGDCRFIDLESGAETLGSVSIVDGAVHAVGEELAPAPSNDIVSLGGDFVVPGFVDIHSHVFQGVGECVDPDQACLGRGTVLAIDGGSAGSASIDAFATIAAGFSTDVQAWLNLATIGLVDTSVGELIPGPYLNPEEAVAAVRRHRGFVIGLKARLSSYAAGGGAHRVLRVLRQVADEVSLPVMVHVGDTQEPLEELLPYLRPGDVVTHALTGRRNGILTGVGALIPAISQAQESGIVFDAARGRNHLSFEVLARAFDQGFLPDTLSTDMSTGVSGDPEYGLATLGDYLLAYSVPLHSVLRRMSVAPAAVVGRRLPTAIETGMAADLTVFRLKRSDRVLRDVDNRPLKSTVTIVPTGTVRAGVYRRIPASRRAAA